MAPSRFPLLRAVLPTLREDLRTDRRLRYLLLIATLTTGFWFWWRSPNFVTADEYGRLLRPMKAGGYFVADPSLESFVRGATDGVPQGATFYLYGLLLVPVALYVVVSGNLEEFGSFAAYQSRWDLWFAVPEWYWHASILVARFANVVLAVTGVYVVYRIGTEAWNRRAGFFSGVVLSLTLVYVGNAHEVNEDTPLVLALLLTAYLALRYVQTGRRTYALWGALAGGTAIAFKLTGGATAFVLGAALLARAHREHGAEPAALLQWGLERGKLIATMLGVGLATTYLGRPNVLFEGPQALLFRTTWAADYASRGSVPLGYPQFHSLFNAAGLALGLTLLVAVGWHLSRTLRGRNDGYAPWILLAGLAPYVVVFGSWSFLKAHHVQPAVVLGVVLLGPLLERASRADRSRVSRAAVAGLLLATAMFAGAGAASFATDPRDQATGWVDRNVAEDERVLVYDSTVADYGVTHDTTVERYDWVEDRPISDQIENYSAYTHWVTTSVDREPEYIMITNEPPTFGVPGRGVDENVSRQSAFYDRLLNGDRFGYEVVATFGEPRREGSYAWELANAGLRPSVEKRASRVRILRHPEASGEGTVEPR